MNHKIIAYLCNITICSQKHVNERQALPNRGTLDFRRDATS